MVVVLYKTRKLINSKCLQSIYFSFIHSCINYANVAWASTNNTKLKKLFGKQKQAVRVIFNQNRFTHARPLNSKCTNHSSNKFAASTFVHA